MIATLLIQTIGLVGLAYATYLITMVFLHGTEAGARVRKAVGEVRYRFITWRTIRQLKRKGLVDADGNVTVLGLVHLGEV